MRWLVHLRRYAGLLLSLLLLAGCQGGGEEGGSGTARLRLRIGSTAAVRATAAGVRQRAAGIPADVAAIFLRVTVGSEDIEDSPFEIPIATGELSIDIDANVAHVLTVTAQNQRGAVIFASDPVTVTLPPGDEKTITIALAAVEVVTPVAEQRVTAAAGGVLEVIDPDSPLRSLRLSVPPGALAQDTTLRAAEVYNPQGVAVLATQAGVLVELGPDGTAFDPPATLVFPYDEGLVQELGLAEVDLLLFRFNPEAGTWLPLPEQAVDTAANVITAQVTTLSFYGVGGGLPAAPPVALDDTATTPEDTPVTVAVLANDGDPNGDPLSVTSVTAPANGTAAINPDGTVTYTPNADFHGTDSFTYTISDPGGLTATATVSLTVTPVNDPPLAQDDTATTAEDTPVTIAVLANDSDVDGDALSVASVSAPANGTATANADGTLTYTPNPNFNGTDIFTYTISDPGGLTATATVSLTVTPVNDPPLAQDDSATTAEDTPVTIAVLANDSDVDGDALSVASVSAPANGTATANADSTVTYTPNLNFHGTDSFTYTISDGQGGTATATVSVTVTPVNDAPEVEQPADQTSDEGDTVSLQIVASDVDGDPLTCSATGLPPDLSIGAETCRIFGTIAFGAAAGSPYSVTVTVSDGTASTSVSFTWTVNPACPPNAVCIIPSAVSAAPGTEFTVTVQYNAGTTNVVSYLFELTFDATVVQVVSITGEAPFDAVATNAAAFTSGAVRFAANNATFAPASGLLTLAKVTFQVVGSTGDTSTLALGFPPTPGGTGVVVNDAFAPISGITFIDASVEVQ
ncbi:MAG: hypothetical protein KatS3mg131_2273 [Candidatus Tectimicrobiota bacterium]|nr:MAG: hypothetical protein KatS3mg131_2273 [Candidatus Tectomicrobia bacterium]